MYFRIAALTICLLSTTSNFALAASAEDQRPPEHSGIASQRSRETLLKGFVAETSAPGGSTSSAAIPFSTPDIVIPEIAKGYEEVYRRFVRGVLIYKQGTAEEVRLPIAALADPLDGVFDLSRCGNTGNHLSIATGFRKAKKAENANRLEIFFAPRFLIEQNIAGSAAHFGHIMGGWVAVNAPVGIFHNWGDWDDLAYFDYLTTRTFDELGTQNLDANWRHTPPPHTHTPHEPHQERTSMNSLRLLRHMLFHVTF